MTEIPKEQFYGAGFLDTVTFPNVTTVGSHAFTYSHFGGVSLHNVTEIPSYMFLACLWLKKIDMPKLRTGNVACFYTCGLEEAVFPELETAGNTFLGGCPYLRIAYLPKLKVFESSLLARNPNLQTVILGPEVKSFNTNVFSQSNPGLEIWHTCTTPANGNANSLKISDGVYPVVWVGPGLKETFKASATYAPCDVREVGVKGVTFGKDTVTAVTLDGATLSASGIAEVADSMAGRVPKIFLEGIGGPALLSLRPQVEYRLKGGASVRKASAKLDGMNVSVKLTGLKDSKTYEYRWICSRDTAVNTSWREFSTKTWSDDIDYTDGTLWLNEDWYGQDNGTVNFIDSTGLVYPRSYRHVNKDHKFGVTSQYGTLYGGRMYVVSKQAGDNGGILTVTDARTLRRIASTSDFGGADGRAFCGATPEKGYVSTNNGIFAVALDSLRVLGRIGGTSTGSDLYSGQVGDMISCPQLTSLNIPGSVKKIPYELCHNDAKLVNLTLNEGTTSIGTAAFHGLRNLKSFTIPSTVTEIVGNPISYTGVRDDKLVCKSPEFIAENGILYSKDRTRLISYNNSATTFNVPAGIKEISAYAFADDVGQTLTEVTLPDGVTTLGTAAFGWYNKLKSINLPSSITTLEEQVFDYCSSLRKIEIPEGIKEIKRESFYYCKMLNNVKLPESLQILGQTAFGYCSQLDSIALPANVKKIGQRAFAGCNKLRSITCFGATPATLSGAATATFVAATVNSGRLHVPTEAVDAYKNANGWKSFVNIIGDVNGVISIDNDNEPCWTVNGNMVEFAQDIPYTVYSLDGRCCANGSNIAKRTVELPSGIYILRAGNKSGKIVVR